MKLSLKQKKIFWLCLFVANVGFLAFMVVAALFAYLVLPDYSFSMTLPMKSWAVLIFGADFKSIMLGFAIYWTYTEYTAARDNFEAGNK